MTASTPLVGQLKPDLAADIPLLTDVLEVDTQRLPVLTEIPVLGEVLSAIDRQALETEVRENVLRSLQSRVDAVLDMRLQETMTEILAHYAQVLQADLKTLVRATLQDVIARAVSQELSRVLAQKSAENK
ncbi:hypothetical protein [Parvibium lacunae]|uniref:DUF2486 family protein n=1 Tax=Parvibium lacunae TaxID=1888893 RepID=A0A368KYC7_9BURK|nr:hypothetical protein [Parvibium lacunae]RCS56460.1 hypothetical protein DU000_12075 [Parvibium lacunae]